MKSISAGARLNPDFKQYQPLPLLPDHLAATGGISWLAVGPDWLTRPAGKKSPGRPEWNGTVSPLPSAKLLTPARVGSLF